MTKNLENIHSLKQKTLGEHTTARLLLFGCSCIYALCLSICLVYLSSRLKIQTNCQFWSNMIMGWQQRGIGQVSRSLFLFFFFFFWIGMLHIPNESSTHDLTLHLALARGGGASWARAHWHNPGVLFNTLLERISFSSKLTVSIRRLWPWSAKILYASVNQCCIFRKWNIENSWTIDV